MAQRCAGLGRGGQGCGNARQDLQLYSMPSGFARLVQGLEHCSGHGKHARVTRRHYHHRAPLRRQLEGMPGALHLFTVVGAMQHLVGAKGPGHTHIGLITEHVVGPRQFGLDRRHHQFRGTRAQANHRQTPTCPADGLRLYGLAGHGNGNMRAGTDRWQ
ncbi:hypothetical protein D3C80_1206300 [compost metagenome]